MKKRNYLIFGFVALLALTIVNVNVTSLKFNDVTITSLKKAFGDDGESGSSNYFISYPSCYNDSNNQWCCLSTVCYPNGDQSCTAKSCPSGTHL